MQEFREAQLLGKGLCDVGRCVREYTQRHVPTVVCRLFPQHIKRNLAMEVATKRHLSVDSKGLAVVL